MPSFLTLNRGEILVGIFERLSPVKNTINIFFKVEK